MDKYQQQRSPIAFTDEGMQSRKSDVHPEKTEIPIRDSRDPDSNVTIERHSHPAKQKSSSNSTDAGMQIDEIDKHPQNAHSARREIRDGESNTTDVRYVE
jgi:hypothetical protein